LSRSACSSSGSELRDIAAGHLQRLRAKLAELQALEAGMDRFIRGCERACAGGPALDCSILETLTQPDGAASAEARGGCCARPAARADGKVP
jgi:hypothetical protein